MKYFLSLAILSCCLFFTTSINAQTDRSKRPSPPAKVSETINSGATVSIDYSQPSLKGRTIGSTVEPFKDSVWRMGANEATVFETDKDVTINNQKLLAGKYAMYGRWTDNGYSVIFNTAYKVWGTQHWENRDKDVLTVPANVTTNNPIQEKLTYTIDKSGLVKLLWGNMTVSFNVQ